MKEYTDEELKQVVINEVAFVRKVYDTEAKTNDLEKRVKELELQMELSTKLIERALWVASHNRGGAPR